MEITQELLHKLFEYKNGILFWKIRPANNIHIGAKAGSLHHTGYYQVRINWKFYRTHRLIFLFHHGYLPKFIDHINGIKHDNRIENLRVASPSQNCHNRRVNKNNTSGVKGVTWHKRDKKWYVRVGILGNLKSFGYYDDLELAELVAIEARNKYHGDFANHG